jgi:prolipoprotein diacylglyceryl transferase
MVLPMTLAYLPSPSQGVWHLGPLPIRAYAFCILAGIAVALWLTGKRWAARGGRREDVLDIAFWAVPFGIVGGRLYHVITDPELYFKSGEDPWRAFAIWDGGLGIWGAVALGGVGAWIGCRRKGIRLAPFADAVAPGLVFAQGIGRWGNYFNQELYGKPSSLPWAIRIDPANRPPNSPNAAFYQPTFFYEMVWDVALGFALLWIDRKYHLTRGRLFAIYVAGYTLGRSVVEWMRDDHANRILGLRLNDWTSLIVFLGAVLFLWVQRNKADEVGLYATEDGKAPSAGDAEAVAEDEDTTEDAVDADADADADETAESSDDAEPTAEAEAEPEAETSEDPEPSEEPETADKK